MKKLWSYIAIFFIGLGTGLIIMFKVVAKHISNTTIKGKIKQKKTHGSVQDVTNTIVNERGRQKDKKSERKLKKETRKIERRLKKST